MKSRHLRGLVFGSLISIFGTTYAQVDEREATCYRVLSGFEKSLADVTPPPRPSSLAGVQLTYAESGCLGKCPSFTFTLTDSEALFEGHAFVHARGSHKSRIERGELERLVNLWFQSGFYAMRDDYCSAVCPNGQESVVTDVQETYVKLNTPAFSKQVHGCYFTINDKSARPKPPDSYFEFRDELLRFLKTKRWI